MIEAALLQIATEVALPRPRNERNEHFVAAAAHELREMLQCNDVSKLSEMEVVSAVSAAGPMLDVLLKDVLSSTSTNAAACLAIICKVPRVRNTFRNTSPNVIKTVTILRKLILEHKVRLKSDSYSAQTVYSIVYVLRELVNDPEIAFALISVEGLCQCLVKILRDGTKDMKTCVTGCIGGISSDIKGCQLLYGHGVVKHLLALLKEEISISHDKESKSYISSLLLSALGALSMLAKLTGPAEAMVEFGITSLLEHCLLFDVDSANGSESGSAIWSRSMNLFYQLASNHSYIGPYLITEKTVDGWIHAGQVADEPSRYVSLQLVLLLAPAIAGDWEIDNLSVSETILSSSKSIDSMISVADDDATKAHKFRHRLLCDGKMAVEDEALLESLSIGTAADDDESKAQQDLLNYKKRRIASLRHKKMLREDKRERDFKKVHVRFGFDFFEAEEAEETQEEIESTTIDDMVEITCLDVMSTAARDVIVHKLLVFVAEKLGSSDKCGTRERLICCQIFHEFFFDEFTNSITVDGSKIELRTWCADQNVVVNTCTKLMSVCRQDLLVIPAQMLSHLMKDESICLVALTQTNIGTILQNFVDTRCVKSIFCENNGSEWEILIFDMLLRGFLQYPTECLAFIKPWLLRQLLVIFDEWRNKFSTDHVPLSADDMKRCMDKVGPFQETIRAAFSFRKFCQLKDCESSPKFNIDLRMLSIDKASKDNVCLKALECLLATMIRKRCNEYLDANNHSLDNDSTYRIPTCQIFPLLADCFLVFDPKLGYDKNQVTFLLDCFEKGCIRLNVAKEIPDTMKQYTLQSIDDFIVVESFFTKFIPFRMQKFGCGVSKQYEDVVGVLDYEDVISFQDWDATDDEVEDSSMQAIQEQEDERDVIYEDSQEMTMEKRSLLLLRELGSIAQELNPQQGIDRSQNVLPPVLEFLPRTRCVKRWLACKSSLTLSSEVVALALYIFRLVIRNSKVFNKSDQPPIESVDPSQILDDTSSIGSDELGDEVLIPEYCFNKPKQSKTAPEVNNDAGLNEAVMKSVYYRLTRMNHHSGKIALRYTRQWVHDSLFERRFQKYLVFDHDKDMKQHTPPEIIKERRLQRAKHAAFKERQRAAQRLSKMLIK